MKAPSEEIYSKSTICDLLLSHRDRIILTVCEILTHKSRKWLVLLIFVLSLTPPPKGNPLEFLDETYSAKTRGMELLCGENFIILTSTVFDWSTRVTDGKTGRRTAIAYSVRCRALKRHEQIHLYLTVDHECNRLNSAWVVDRPLSAPNWRRSVVVSITSNIHLPTKDTIAAC